MVVIVVMVCVSSPTFRASQGVFDALVDAVQLGGGGCEHCSSLGFAQLVQLLWPNGNILETGVENTKDGSLQSHGA